ncbi:MAG: mannitol dehydrogenase [Clostridia bacterium]|nr:mannitol dehydrogenase [Clostridia bacterium]
MKAVIFGAGNIGRGFIAPLFSLDGWNVTFIDVAKPVVERINCDGEYPLTIVDSDKSDVITIKNVSAIDGNDKDAASRAVADADVCATCVGAKAIKYILPNFAAGVKLRYNETKRPTNLLICENLMDADAYIKDLLKEYLTQEELDSVGLIETSVGRMVPVPKQKGEGENPLSISVEEYGVLPVDRDAIKGDGFTVKNIVPFSPFHYYIERKLYIHNMGHAITAYLGEGVFEDEYIYQSISRADVRLIAEDAMIESALALSKKYNVDFEPLMRHVWDLIRRFANSALGDTTSRVGADIPRKLARSDRLIGAAENALSQGVVPAYICIGAGAALNEYMKQNPELQDAIDAFRSLTGLDADSVITKYSFKFYEMFKERKPLSDVIAAADQIKKREAGMIV